MQKLDSVTHHHSKMIELYLKFENKSPFSEFITYTREKNPEIFDTQIKNNKILKGSFTSVVLTVKSNHYIPHNEIIELLNNFPGIHYIEKLQ